MNFFNDIQWSPEIYESTAVVAADAEKEMLSRLEWMTINPQNILDVGCGLGNASQELQLRYPEAKIIAVDMNFEMVQFTQKRLPGANCFNADANSLPFKDHTFDLIFANFLLPWCNDIPQLLSAWLKLLKPNGLLLFTILGPDTLQEIKTLNAEHRLPNLIDMHDIGDALVRAGFLDPVIDTNFVTIEYHQSEQLVTDIVGSGMTLTDDAATLNTLLQREAHGTLNLTYEMIFAHSFAPEFNQLMNDAKEVSVPLHSFKKMLYRK